MSELPLTFHELDGIERVIADPLRFKQRLHIGRKAFKTLTAKDTLYSMWDTFGVATTGAAVANSSLIATTFFAPTGIMAWLGLATAATPIGWVIAAAVVSGTAYIGVTRYLAPDETRYVDVIPKYINTPIDLLAFSLFGLIGRLAVNVAASDGVIAPRTRSTIVDHFCRDWGYAPEFVERALSMLESQVEANSTSEVAKLLAAFQAQNPDCNAPTMQKELVAFLREVIEADGVVTDREQAALEEAAASFEQHWLSALRLQATESAFTIGRAAGEAASMASTAIGDVANSISGRLAEAVSKAREGK